MPARSGAPAPAPLARPTPSANTPMFGLSFGTGQHLPKSQKITRPSKKKKGLSGAEPEMFSPNLSNEKGSKEWSWHGGSDIAMLSFMKDYKVPEGASARSGETMSDAAIKHSYAAFDQWFDDQIFESQEKEREKEINLLEN